MYQYDLYLASLNIHVTSEMELPFRENEKIFQTPSMDIRKKEEVYVCRRSYPEPTPETLLNEGRIFTVYSGETEGTEVRYFRDGVFRNGYARSYRNAEGTMVVEIDPESDYLENINFSLLNLIQLENMLLKNDSLLLHCAYMEYQNQAILFSAPSGTGKTTQAKLWEKYRPQARIVNGDKGLLYRRNGEWLCCGFPLHGSADECYNENYPIRCIAIVRQAPADSVIELTLAQKVRLLFSECTVNLWNIGQVDRAFSLLTDLASQIQVIQLNCTRNESAVERLEQYLNYKC